MSRLRDRYGGWAIVTGASSGIGSHFAEALAGQGFPLVLTARREDRLDALAAKLDVESLVVQADLADESGIDTLRAAIGDREVGLLVNNAGFGYSGRFADRDAADDARMVALNCRAPLLLTHAVLPQMLRRGRGGIVFVGSTASFQPDPFFAVYGATKAFLLSLSESLSEELDGSGVDVLALCPGETVSEFAEQAHFGRDAGGMDARVVVDAALRGLAARRRVVVPGALNKLTSFITRLVPRKFAARATAKVLARELQQTTPNELRARPYEK